MNVQRIRDRLLPNCEQDAKFREALERMSAPSLATLAIIEIAIPILLEAGRAAASPHGTFTIPQLWQVASMVAVGALTLLVSHLSWSRRHARVATVISAWLSAAALTWVSFWKPEMQAADDYVLAAITLVMLTAVAIVPLRPWQALALGLGVVGMYILSSVLPGNSEISSIFERRDSDYIFLGILTILTTGIAAINYEHRRSEFLAVQDTIRIAEALSGAQLRAQLAENAISIGKMAAALSHEINSPVGALLSSVDTILAVADRQMGAPEQRERLAGTRAELRRAISASAARIEDVTRRLRRFVNLDDAELKMADINDLVTDVALLHRDAIDKAGVKLEFDLEKPIPALQCRPQLLSAVFSTLLMNGIQAVNGDGRIGIRTRRHDGEVEITIADNGRGMSADQAATIFDPIFKVDGNRVSSGNWSLFNTRQIVYEHGGEIRLDTAEGKGTTIQVVLPVG